MIISDFNRMDLNLLYLNFYTWRKMDLYLLRDLYPFILQIFVAKMLFWAQKLMSQVKGRFESAL